MSEMFDISMIIKENGNDDKKLILSLNPPRELENSTLYKSWFYEIFTFGNQWEWKEGSEFVSFCGIRLNMNNLNIAIKFTKTSRIV